MVVTCASPTSMASVMHEQTGLPSRCTVQALHAPRSQTTLVPVRPSWKRSASASVAAGSTLIWCMVRFTFRRDGDLAGALHVRARGGVGERLGGLEQPRRCDADAGAGEEAAPGDPAARGRVFFTHGTATITPIASATTTTSNAIPYNNFPLAGCVGVT